MDYHPLPYGNPGPTPTPFTEKKVKSGGNKKKILDSSSSNNNHRSTHRSGPMKLSTDPQSVAARQRRHRISDRFKMLQSLVPGGQKLDTVSMLDEAIHYVKFLKTQIWLHQTMFTLMDDEYNYPAGTASGSMNCPHPCLLAGASIESSSTYLEPVKTLIMSGPSNVMPVPGLGDLQQGCPSYSSDGEETWVYGA